MLPIVVALLLPPKRRCLESPWNKFWSVGGGKAPMPSYAFTTRMVCNLLMLPLSSLQIPSLYLKWLGTPLYQCNFLSFSGNCMLPWITEIIFVYIWVLPWILEIMFVYICMLPWIMEIMFVYICMLPWIMEITLCTYVCIYVKICEVIILLHHVLWRSRQPSG